MQNVSSGAQSMSGGDEIAVDHPKMVTPEDFNEAEETECPSISLRWSKGQRQAASLQRRLEMMTSRQQKLSHDATPSRQGGCRSLENKYLLSLEWPGKRNISSGRNQGVARRLLPNGYATWLWRLRFGFNPLSYGILCSSKWSVLKWVVMIRFSPFLPPWLDLMPRRTTVMYLQYDRILDIWLFSSWLKTRPDSRARNRGTHGKKHE